MRNRLEAEASAKDVSVAQVLLWHVRQSLIREMEKVRDPAGQAINYLISELLERIRWVDPINWQGNPFAFRTFKLAIKNFLDVIEPKGELRPPPIKEIAKILRIKASGPLADTVRKEWEADMTQIWKIARDRSDQCR